MIRQEDLIKHSGIIEYLKERIEYYQKNKKQYKMELSKFICEKIIDELETNLEHFEEVIESGNKEENDN